jgi:O-succinylbenzoate synthase
MPLVAPFETSFGRETDRQCVLIILQSDGLTGYGECVATRDPGYNYETAGTAWHILKDFVAPLILEQDVIDAPDFQTRVEGIRGHHLAKAGVEMALWDLLGKRDGKSLKEMFGGTREKVEVGVSIGIQESASALVRTVESYLEKGYRRVKIKIKPGREVDETSAVRKAYPDLRLQVDANSAYTLETADALKPLDALNLLLIEQPLFEDDIWDHRKLQAGFVLPGDISASDRYYQRDITNERFVLNDDSTINVPTGPGLGITIDEGALKEFTLSQITLKAG